MSAGEALALVAAGIGAGITGTVAGLASLVSYPALLALGIPPVAANVTNTVALTGNTIGSVAGSRPELRGQGRRNRELAPIMLLGGALGALLLLTTPSGGFTHVVPFLIAGSALVVLLRPRIQAALVRRRERLLGEHHLPDPDTPLASGARIGALAVGAYGGYFGAGAGVMLMALLSLATSAGLVRVNALKNLHLGLANGVAALGFALFGPVHWPQAALLALGCLGGSYVSPAIVRAIPPGLLRWLIGVAGLYLAVKLGLDAY